MKIMMLNPPFIERFSRDSRSPERSKGNCLYYPIYLSYATGVLEKEGFKVRLLDAVAENIGHKKAVDITKRFNPELIVINTSTPSIYNDLSIGSWIKKRLPNSFVTLVGTHPTALPEQTLQLEPNIDAIARGEYDYTIRDLALTLEKGGDLNTVQGLTFRSGNSIIHNPDRPFIKDLDEIPFVSEVYKKHLNIKKYFYPTVPHPEVTILTGRGCPFQCSFCLYSQVWWKGNYRLRSIENVVDEFEYIVNELPVRGIMIEDDTLTINKKRAREISREIIKRGIKIKWCCNSRADVDYETMKIMKKAGCSLFCVGFESGSQMLLNNVHKGTKIEKIKKFMTDSKKAGIKIHGCFILGLREGSKRTVEDTIKFAIDLDPDTVQFYPLMVYPGTPDFEWAKQNKFLKTEDWAEWITEEGVHNTVIDRPSLSSEYLVKKCDEALRRFYFRPKKILSIMLNSLKNRDEFARYFGGFTTFVNYLRGGFKFPKK